MAHGDYDPNLDGQTYTDDPDKDPDNDGWPTVDANSYDEKKTAAPMGGADGVGGLTDEVVGNFNSANEWCDSLGDHTLDKCSRMTKTLPDPGNLLHTQVFSRKPLLRPLQGLYNRGR